MKFIKVLPYGDDPILPMESLEGEIPVRAFQFCEPFLAANRTGWLLNPPVSFELVWTGREFLTKFDTLESWIKVDKIFLPDFFEYWQELAPSAAHQVGPPFLEAFPERGAIQVWSGYFVETDADHSTWVRAPINRNGPSAYQVYEGIVETDWWLGPLFTIFQFVKSDDPVRFESTRPWMQVIDVPKIIHQPRRAIKPTIEKITDLNNETWTKIINVSDQKVEYGRFGSYRVQTRVKRNDA